MSITLPCLGILGVELIGIRQVREKGAHLGPERERERERVVIVIKY